MYASIVLAATALLGAVSAAPLTNVVRTNVVRTTPTYPAYWNTSGLTNSTSSSHTTLTTAVPSSSAAPNAYPAPIATILPEYTSQYNGASGAVDFHTPRGFVSRHPKNGGADISTLVTFQLDKKYASNQCQVVFDLNDPSSYAKGSMKAQLFTSLAPAQSDSKSWPSGNLRDQNLGAIQAYPSGRATWQAGSGPGATSGGFFPCKNIAGMIYGGEVVPQGDDVEFSWPAGKDGIKIIVW